MCLVALEASTFTGPGFLAGWLAYLLLQTAHEYEHNGSSLKQLQHSLLSDIAMYSGTADILRCTLSMQDGDHSMLKCDFIALMLHCIMLHRSGHCGATAYLQAD